MGKTGQEARRPARPSRQPQEPAILDSQRPALEGGASEDAFASFGLQPNLLRAIADAGFTEARPIQHGAIPACLEGRDVLGLAQTGTGKTAAFALPILERLTTRRPAKNTRGPRALVVAPTRELAQQIKDEFDRLAIHTKIKVTTIFGGVGAAPQIKAMRGRPDVVVACPGRLLDLVGSGNAHLGDVEVLVLDEADHMFDMGFLPDVKRILDRLPRERQNLLFSATMPKEIRKLADRILVDPHVVELNHSSPAETIEHALYPVQQSRKGDLLRHVLRASDFRSAIVFLRTKHRARRLAQDLDKAGYRAIALQGNMSQGQRVRAMQGFRDGYYDVLVATDIAARGIDVAKVSHVINFDVPNTPDAYTHRIGRTGRAECTGKAFTFVTPEDFEAVKAIERKIGVEIPRVKLAEFRGGDVASLGANLNDRPARGQRQGGGRGGNAQPAGGGRGAGGPRRERDTGRSKPKGSRGRGGRTRSAAPEAGVASYGAAMKRSSASSNGTNGTGRPEREERNGRTDPARRNGETQAKPVRDSAPARSSFGAGLEGKSQRTNSESRSESRTSLPAQDAPKSTKSSQGEAKGPWAEAAFGAGVRDSDSGSTRGSKSGGSRGRGRRR